MTTRTAKPRYKIPQYRLRLVKERTVSYPVGNLDSSQDAADILHGMLDDLDRENFVVIFMNGQNQPIGCETIGIGSTSQCPVFVREVFKGALLAGASGIIVGHNHPCGDVRPSPDDITSTKAICEAGKVIGLPVLDHVIVVRKDNARKTYFSFLDQGMI